MSKKSAFISVRIDEDTKNYLSQVADTKKWTVSFLVSEIIKEWKEKKDGE